MRIFFLALAVSASLFAGTVSISRGGGTAYNAGALTGFATTGAMMDGMVVTAWFTDGSSSSAVWGDTGASSGAATSAGNFVMQQSGDTFGGIWGLSNLSAAGMTMFRISGREGKTVFDTIMDPEDTPGSARGWPYEYSPAANAFPDVRIAYTDDLSIGGTFYNDLYLTLTGTFGTPLAAGSAINFIQDTDNVPVDDIIIPRVPEPGTYALMGLGLAALALRRRLVQ